MVRPTAEFAARQAVRKFLQTKRTQRKAAIYWTLVQKGPTMRFEEIWDSSLVKDQLLSKSGKSSKSVLRDLLEDMRRGGLVRIERKGRKFMRITLQVTLPEVWSREVDKMLFAAASIEMTVKRLIWNIEAKSITPEEAHLFIRGTFIEAELERLRATSRLLSVYRDPILWPFLCGYLVESLIVLPAIHQLQILNACVDTYPKATSSALESLANSLLNVLRSCQFKEYQIVFDKLDKPAS